MQVELTADQKAFARQAVQMGRLHREEEVIEEALALWESRERTRAEILAEMDLAEVSLARGEGRIITEQSMLDLAEDVKRRGHARFLADRNARA